MAQYVLFPFTPELMDSFKEKLQIPVDFYNKNGQVLIHKKVDATVEEIDALFNFMDQGIYYNLDDEEKLIVRKKQNDAPEGLTNTRLISEKHAGQLTEEAKELFTDLKSATSKAINGQKTMAKMNEFFDDFESQPDAMVGLINILELLKDDKNDHYVQASVKRTVVAMGIKTRGMYVSRSFKDKKMMKEAVSALMVSAMLCDVGCFRMNMPGEKGLTKEQMDYVRLHPIMSYLIVAHDRTLSSKIKHNILCHHRPKTEGLLNNNYPNNQQLIQKLSELYKKYRDDAKRTFVVKDIHEQVNLLKAGSIHYDEDLNILALSSEFASLTTNVPWRPAYTAVDAVRLIINNSYFSYSARTIREFLDHVAISLCDNELIIKEGDIIIIASRTSEGRVYFEVCSVLEVNRYQSRPRVKRLATIKPVFHKDPKYRIHSFAMETLEEDRRKAEYMLTNDDTRQIIYIPHPYIDPELYNKLQPLQRKIKRINQKKPKG